MPTAASARIARPRSVLGAWERLGALALAAVVVWGPLAMGAVEKRAWTSAPLWVLAGLALVATMVARSHEKSRGPSWGPVAPGLVLAAAFLGWASLPLPAGADPVLNAGRLLSLGAALAAGVTAYHLSARGSRLLPWVILAIGSLESVVTLLQATGALPITAKDPPYPAGTYVNHNHLAGFLEVALPIALVLALVPSRRRSPVGPPTGAAVLMGAALVLSQSRGGWLAAGVGLAVLLYLLRHQLKSKRLLASVLGLVVVGGAFVTLTGGEALRTRAATLEREALIEGEQLRVGFWRASLAMVWEHPIRGVGLGAFGVHYPRHRPEGGVLSPRYSHNDYLQTAAEGGLPALLLLLLGLGAVAWPLYKGVLDGPSAHSRALAAAGLASLASYAAHGLVDFNMQIPANLLALAVLLGVGIGEGQVRDSEDPSAPEGPVSRPLLGLGLLGLGALAWVSLGLARGGWFRVAAEEAVREEAAAEALDFAEQAVRYSPADPLAWVELARAVHLRAKSLDGKAAIATLASADACYARALASTPGRVRVRVERALVLQALEDAGGSPAVSPADELARCQRDGPNDPLVLLPLGLEQLRQGHRAEALELVRRALAMAPDYALKNTLLIPFRKNRGDPEFLESVLPPDYVPGWIELARAYQSRGEDEGSLRAWTRARDSLPEDAEIRLGRGVQLVAMGRYEEALRDLQSAQANTEGELPAELFGALHQALQGLGMADEAEQVAREATGRFPDDSQWLLAVGRARAAAGEYYQALRFFQQLAREHEDSPHGPLALGEVKAQRGRRLEDRQLLWNACSDLREALRRDPSSADALQLLATLYVELGDQERALATLERVVDGGISRARDLIRLADIYVGLGRLRPALRLLAKASDVAEDLGLEVDGRSIARRRLEVGMAMVQRRRAAAAAAAVEDGGGRL